MLRLHGDLLFAAAAILFALCASADTGAPAGTDPVGPAIRIYLDAPESYGSAHTANAVIIGIANRTGQPIRTLDFAGCRLWHTEPSGEWVRIDPGHPEPSSQPANADLDANLSAVTLEIASKELVNTDRWGGGTISRGIGYVVIAPHSDHLYQVDIGRRMSRPGEYQLKAVLTRGGKPVYESPIRTLRIEPRGQ